MKTMLFSSSSCGTFCRRRSTCNFRARPTHVGSGSKIVTIGRLIGVERSNQVFAVVRHCDQCGEFASAYSPHYNNCMNDLQFELINTRMFAEQARSSRRRDCDLAVNIQPCPRTLHEKLRWSKIGTQISSLSFQFRKRRLAIHGNSGDIGCIR